MVRAERFSIALMVGALSIAAGHRLAAQEQPPPPQQPSNPAIEDWKPDKLVNVVVKG